ncbi:secreted protein [Melampsora americana]|nr:secreted protein [Melampsora americana]
MLFFKLVIAAVLAITISSTPTQKDQITTDAVLQRRVTLVKVFEKRQRRNCANCGPAACSQINSECQFNSL